MAPSEDRSAGEETPETRPKFSLSGSTIFLFVPIALLIIDLIMFFLVLPRYSSPSLLMLAVTREQSIANWYSVCVTFLVALAFGRQFFERDALDMTRIQFLVSAVLALCFLFLSFDDATKFHETLGTQTYNQLGGRLNQDSGNWIDQFPSYTWHLLYAPLIIGGTCILVMAARFEKPQAWWRSLTSVGIGLLVLAVFFDFIEGIPKYSQTIKLFSFIDHSQIAARHIFKAIEETLEMMGMSFILLGTLRTLPSVKRESE